MRQEKRPLVQARLQALYLYKSGQEQDYAAIGIQVGYERHTIGKWFSRYSQKGLAACQQLEISRKSGSLISGKALAELQEKLCQVSDYFTSYKQIYPLWKCLDTIWYNTLIKKNFYQFGR